MKINTKLSLNSLLRKQRNAHFQKRGSKRILAMLMILLTMLPWSFTSSREPLAGQPAREKIVSIDPADFGGVDLCLRDTSGETNECSRRYGVVRSADGKPERPCLLGEKALKGLKKARAELKKINPDLELMVVSSYRPPAHQQCLWVKKTPEGYKCNSAVCGPRNPATGEKLPCREYDLTDPRYEHIFDHCPHVNLHTVDICAYNTKKVKLNERNQLDMTVLEDCRKAANPNYLPPQGFYYHPCTCRFTSWTNDIRNASPRTKIFKHGGAEEQQAMIRAMRTAGWRDNAPGEWWHFQYFGD